MLNPLRRRLVGSVLLLGVTVWAAQTQAAVESFKVSLTGTQQVPAVETTGTGTADLSYDPATRVVSWSITYTGLSGPVTMAHFHGPAEAGKNAGVQLSLLQQGSAAESPIKGQATLTAEQAEQFVAGQWYINLHTQAHPGGEIRAQVTPSKG